MNHVVQMRSQYSSLLLHLCVGAVLLMVGLYDVGSTRDPIGGDAGEFIVLLDTKYVAKESVVVCC